MIASENIVPRRSPHRQSGIGSDVRVSASLALEVFKQRCSARAVLFANGMIDLHQAVDGLQNSAVAYGLVEEFGQDAVQAVISTAFEASQESILSVEHETDDDSFGAEERIQRAVAATVRRWEAADARDRPLVSPHESSLPNGPDDYGLPVGAKEEAAIVRPTQPAALNLTYFDECDAFVEKQHILKGIIARGETSAWIAPPGAGKSALLTEIAVHCAAQIDWRGHKAKKGCGVIILALERGDLFRRRLWVYYQRDGLRGLPIAVADAVVDLLDPACVESIVATVREAERHFGRDVGLIIIDTYAKGIAANGGDEDKARDQNRAAANLRSVHSRLNVHIALVGHTGKDETRGARGSNAHVGDVDVMVQISGNTMKVAQVIKGNDQPERVIAQFKLESFEFGRDEDGDPITTAIISKDFDGDSAVPKSKQVKLRSAPTAALRALHECIADGEHRHRPTSIFRTALKVSLWTNGATVSSNVRSSTLRAAIANSSSAFV